MKTNTAILGLNLEEINIPGQSCLRDSLTCCDDPLKTIEQFQLDNGISHQALQPMLPLLDLHGIPRLDFHTSLLEELKYRLVIHIKQKQKEKQIKELLSKTFKCVKFKPLRPVVMCLLKNSPHVEKNYLNTLVQDKELYDDTDIEIKQIIWKDHQLLFNEEVSVFVTQYIQDKESFFNNNLSNLFSSTPKTRRKNKVVQKLVKMIGRSVRLYNLVLYFLKKSFLRTNNVHYCTLRAEILMALHDLEIQDIISVDPCHRFAWCLDACIREKSLNDQRSKDLQSILDNINNGDVILGDVAILLSDPCAINFLGQFSIEILQRIIDDESLPRDNTVLILLLRMLKLGLKAGVIIQNGKYNERKLDSRIISKFVPALMSLMIDGQIRAINYQLSLEEDQSGPDSDICRRFVTVSNVASVLVMHYAIHAARRKDKNSLIRVISILSACHNGRAYEDTFLQSFVSYLIPMSYEFTNHLFCTAIFNKFFQACLTRDNVKRHVFKLIGAVHNKMAPDYLHLLMQMIEPTSDNDTIHQLYKALQRKINKNEEEP